MSLSATVRRLKYLLLVEVLRAELKLLVLGFHGFAQFLQNLRGYIFTAQNENESENEYLCCCAHGKVA